MDANSTSRIFKDLLVAYLPNWKLYATNQAVVENLLKLTQKMMQEYRVPPNQVMSHLEKDLPEECKEFYTFFAKSHLNEAKTAEVKLPTGLKQEEKKQHNDLEELRLVPLFYGNNPDNAATAL